jgi:SOS-response transcriptional repressor LexA
VKVTDEQVMTYITDFIAMHRYAPSIAEVGARFGLVKSAAKRHIDALERDGRILRTANVARSIVIPEDYGTESRLIWDRDAARVGR